MGSGLWVPLRAWITSGLQYKYRIYSLLSVVLGKKKKQLSNCHDGLLIGPSPAGSSIHHPPCCQNVLHKNKMDMSGAAAEPRLSLPFQTPCPHSHPQLTATQSLGQTPGLCYSRAGGEAERGRGLDPFSGSVCFSRQGQLRGCSTCTGLSLPPSLSHTHCSEPLQAWRNALPPGASTLHWFLN